MKVTIKLIKANVADNDIIKVDNRIYHEVIDGVGTSGQD